MDAILERIAQLNGSATGVKNHSAKSEFSAKDGQTRCQAASYSLDLWQQDSNHE
jgi:hypothetical protein